MLVYCQEEIFVIKIEGVVVIYCPHNRINVLGMKCECWGKLFSIAHAVTEYRQRIPTITGKAVGLCHLIRFFLFSLVLRRMKYYVEKNFVKRKQINKYAKKNKQICKEKVRWSRGHTHNIPGQDIAASRSQKAFVVSCYFHSCY